MRKKIWISILLTFSTILSVFTIIYITNLNQDEPRYMAKRSYQQTFDPIQTMPLDDRYMSYTYFRENIATASATVTDIQTAVSGKYLRIDNAEELYRFSIDVSYNLNQIYVTPNPTENVKLSYEVIELLLSLDYVLGNNIDYSEARSKQFVPIGYRFTSIDTSIKENIFTGTFDGRGFEIANLYLAGYEYITTIEGEQETAVDLALSPYYSMFTYNAGTISNLGLINPTLELMEEHQDIFRAANLVGQNTATGVVENVYVIDERTDPYEAGIRLKIPLGTTTTRFSASGIVHDNLGTFRNSYYVSKIVVNASYINNFSVQPLVYQNSGTIAGLVYDSTVYLKELIGESINYTIPTPNSNHIGESTATIKSTSSSLDPTVWNFYPLDGYPILFGLQYVNGAYQIENTMDMIAFSYIVNFSSVNNGVTYKNADYVLTNDINMSSVSDTAYVTPYVEFTGSFTGAKVGGGNYTIGYLTIKNGTFYNGVYYLGLFSILKGSFNNVSFYHTDLSITNSESYYSAIFRIGVVAGTLDNGRIDDVLANYTIHLGITAIGKIQAGGIVGYASGTVQDIFTSGTLDAGIHAFKSEYNVISDYQIGGIVGASGANKLTLYNVNNTSQIYSIGSSSPLTTNNSFSNVSVGGVIGSITNTSTVKHMIGLLTNDGKITIQNLQSIVDVQVFAGGIFGLSQGSSYTLSDQFGRLENRGQIVANGLHLATTVRAAGIGVSNHSENVEFIHLINNVNTAIQPAFSSDNMDIFTYTSLIYDVGNSVLTLSQVVNYADFTFNEGVPLFSPLFFSENNAPAFLRYAENAGDLTYYGFSLYADTYINGITESSNVNYLNVYYSGNILVYQLNLSGYNLWVAGFSKTLTAGKYIKNSLNEGTITVASINTGTSTSGHYNLYIGGLVNFNDAGDLSTQDSSNQPRATEGIINSVNYASISTTYNTTYYGIQGYGNLYAGGVATFNNGSIQDVTNLGDIKVANTSTIASSGSPTTTFNYYTDSTSGGQMIRFSGGITLGGVASAATNGDSRIYDSANNGNIIGISSNYVRAGGILGVALYTELVAGGAPVSSSPIEDSILSNGLNYGNVSAVTDNIAYYSSIQYTSSIQQYTIGTSVAPGVTITTTEGTNERPPIYSVAGGVIGYGLSVMRRMLNHGDISATDVAGGIVGATYVTGVNSVITDVFIDTAIHYGRVRAIKEANYNLIDKADIQYSNISAQFYTDNNSFIFPSTISGDITRYPEAKRGFGGIFGRLQRGANGVMTSENGIFNFIINADPNVDLIGRLDQVYRFTSSAKYFRFTNCIYYSARQNDTTQAVFKGYFLQTSTLSSSTNNTYYDLYATSATTTYTSTKQGNSYYWTINTSYNITSGISYSNASIDYTFKNVGNYLWAPSYTRVSSNVGTAIGAQTLTTTVTATVSGSSAATAFDAGTYTEIFSGPTLVKAFNSSNSLTVPTTGYISAENVAVPRISETDGVAGTEYMYASNFIMRNPNTKLPNGEAITSYIYYAENEILAERFVTTRPNGMYVLSTTAGSSFGSVLPANIDITKVYRLLNEIPFYSEYDNVNLSEKQPFPDVIDGVYDRYNDLLQTKYNDKSKLLVDTQTIGLQEIGGSNTELLITPTSIDYNNQTITYEVSMEAFGTQTITQYRIVNPVLPANALIGAHINDYQGGAYSTDIAGFLALLREDKDLGVSPTVAPSLSIDISPYENITADTAPIFIGRFVSYSESAYHIPSFLNSQFTTEYQVYIILTPDIAHSSLGTIGINNVTIDGTDRSVATILSYPVVSTIRFNFTDTKGILNPGASIQDFITLYFGTELVDPMYYQLSSTVVSGGNFSVTIQMPETLRTGTYTMKYRYFSASNEYGIDFNNAASSLNLITSLRHITYDEYVAGGTSFTTYINFGYPVQTSSITYQPTIAPGIPSYLDNTTYEIVFEGDVGFMSEFIISPFSQVASVSYIGTIYSNGYKTYQFQYVIQAENGTSTTYTHNITERSIGINAVYKNNNMVPLDNIVATREAISTTFSIDLGIDPDYAQSIYQLIDQNPVNYFTVQVTSAITNIQGISYTADDRLNVIMSSDTLPGTYTFTIVYVREGGMQSLQVASFNVMKLEGVSAYLKNIRFSKTTSDTGYAKIYESDSNGVINASSLYDLRIYFGGIDYDGANLAGVQHFRIDGTVANTPLNEYAPVFIEYLPFGATISRQYYENGQYLWTAPVGATSTEAEKESLITDFTVLPETGQEPVGDEEVIITYRVTSEDGTSDVYYHITVIDIVYNVSIIFDIYYVDALGEVIAYNSNELKSKTILINIKNFVSDTPIGSDAVGGVQDFLPFTQIISINNNTSQFFVPYDDTYRYSFGRNISGFYSFNLDLPLNQNGDHLYDYYITYNGSTLPDISSYVPGQEGKYYYIEYGTRNRTRRFNVYISKLTDIIDNPTWGLIDYYDTWSENQSS